MDLAWVLAFRMGLRRIDREGFLTVRNNVFFGERGRANEGCGNGGGCAAPSRTGAQEPTYSGVAQPEE